MAALIASIALSIVAVAARMQEPTSPASPVSPTSPASPRAQPEAPARAPEVVRVGDVVRGEIVESSAVVHTPALDAKPSRFPFRGVTFRCELPIGTTTIELRSWLFDAYLVVRDLEGEVLAEDDDGLLASHARVVLEPEAATTVEITACARSGRRGTFELRLFTGAPAELDPPARTAAEIEDARQELACREEVLGPEDLDISTSLNNLAYLLKEEGHLAEARALYERALTIREAVLGPDHPVVASSLANLASLLEDQGDHEEALRMCERAVTIREQALGRDHPDLVTSLNNLAVLLRSSGRYDESQTMFERALAICEKASGPEDPSTLTMRNNLAGLLESRLRFDEARALYEQMLEIREKVLGPDHPATAASLNNLAHLLRAEGRYDEARPLYERALAIHEKALGPDHPATASSLNNLAVLFDDMGRQEAARPLYERALAIRERVLGPDHPATATTLENLAQLLRTHGELEEARPLYERALQICEKVRGPDHPDTAWSLDNLAGLLASQDRYHEARPLYERALAIREKVFGPDHPSTAASLSNLAALLQSLDQLEEARLLVERVLAIHERVFGPDHPDTAQSLRNLGALLQYQGRSVEARPLYERALAIREKVLGPGHPTTTSNRFLLAVLLLDLGEFERAASLARSGFDSVLAHARREAALAPERSIRRLAFELTDAFEFLLSLAPNDASAADDRLEHACLARSEGFRLQRERHRSLATSVDPALRAQLARLRSVTAAQSDLCSLRDVPDRDQFERDTQQLRKEREQLERDVASLIETRPEYRAVTAAEIRASLPIGAALVVLSDNYFYERTKWNDGVVASPGNWSARRLTAWVTKPGDAAAVEVDLGSSATIETAIEDYLVGELGVGGQREARGAVPLEIRPNGKRAEVAERLRRLVWDPLAPHVGAAMTLFVAPDGPLTTLPLGIIELDDGHHLLETRRFVVVDDVQALVRSAGAASAAASTARVPSLLAVGGLAYDERAAAPAWPAAPDGFVAAADLRGSFTATWSALSQTRPEAVGISVCHEKRFRQATRLSLTDAAATEERLKRELPNYSVLHLATHGYFLVDGLKSVLDTIREQGDRKRLESDERSLLEGYWPELLCGLVCSGANHAEPGRDNGLLTADEVGSLDLSCCDLVVLSACETALGERAAGDGLLSLDRAFREAGANTVISSLWQVRDDSTKELMLDFYDRMWNHGEGKLDALRDAQLGMLRRNRERYGDTRPAAWGAFVLTGETD